MLLLLPLLMMCVTYASCGSLCPPRENIYPCSCTNIHQSKKLIHTVIHCHRLRDATALSAIFPTLRTMQIDQFHLYDSFWGVGEEARQSLPTDWFTLLKVKELEIVDTELSACFACQWKLPCRNSVTTRFTSVNSTSNTSMCVFCETGSGVVPWTRCLSRLKTFHWSHSRLTSLGADEFRFEMKELTLLNLTHNRISRVDPKALVNLKRLTRLDLSHNAIEVVNFVTQQMNLEFLDLSWNNIKAVGPIFNYLPYLKTFKAESNFIENLKESDWIKAPESLMYIDLSDNPLHCDCSVRFVNSTFHVSAVVQGSCLSPPDYENSALRKASRMLSERCDEDGSIGTRKKSAVTAPMRGWW